MHPPPPPAFDITHILPFAIAGGAAVLVCLCELVQAARRPRPAKTTTTTTTTTTPTAKNATP